MSDILYQQGMEIVRKISITQSRKARVDCQELEEAGEKGLMFAVSKYKQGDFRVFARRCIAKCIRDRIVGIYRKEHKTVSLTNLPEKLHPITKTYAYPYNPKAETILHNATKKERVVLKMVMSGYNQDEMAEELGVTDRTIRNIINKIRKDNNAGR